MSRDHCGETNVHFSSQSAEVSVADVVLHADVLLRAESHPKSNVALQCFPVDDASLTASLTGQILMYSGLLFDQVLPSYLFPRPQIVHMGWACDSPEGSAAGRTSAFKFLALRGPYFYIFRNPPVIRLLSFSHSRNLSFSLRYL